MGSIELTATPFGAQETTKNVLSGINVQTGSVHVGNAEYEELIPENSVNIAIGVFMGGTLNNKRNTKARQAYDSPDDKTRKLITRFNALGAELKKQGLAQPKFKYKEQGKLYRFLNDVYNGEYFNTIENNPLVTEYQNFPPPKRVAFRWSDKNDNKYGCRIYFDETEIWEAFKKIYANPKTKQAELVI
jgi:hypothetical protein